MNPTRPSTSSTFNRVVERIESLPGWLRALLVLTLVGTLLITNRLASLTANETRANDSLAGGVEVVYVPDQRLSRAIALGYDQAAADLLWIRTIGYFTKHFITDRRYPWLEYFVEQILTLDPHWRLVYHWAGATVLYGRRFTNENVMLSNHFYQRALERFPEDHEAAYRLGVNYYVEMKSQDPEEQKRFRETGLSYLELAANIPSAPSHLRSLVASISRRLGKSQLALQYLIDLYLATDDPEQRKDLRVRIDAVRAEQGSDQDMLAAADRFDRRWKATFPYVSPPMYGLLGEPAGAGVEDRPWKTLTPDIAVRDDQEPEPAP
ncbi:MAG: hypothetical protein R3F60_01270 [bacterium]